MAANKYLRKMGSKAVNRILRGNVARGGDVEGLERKRGSVMILAYAGWI